MDDSNFSDIVSRQKTKLDRIYARGELSFTEVTEAVGLDPSSDFVGVNLSQVDFSNCDLSKYDFRRANLNGCNFQDAIVNLETIDEHYHPMLTYQGVKLGHKMQQPQQEGQNPRATARRLVGEFIRMQIIKRYGTIREFSDAAEVSQGAVSNILNGKSQISLRMAQKLAKSLGANPEYWRSLVEKTISQAMIVPDFEVTKTNPVTEVATEWYEFRIDGRTLEIQKDAPQHIIEIAIREFSKSLKASSNND